MPISKRSIWGFAGLATLVAGVVFVLLVYVGGAGESAVEAWVGKQLIAVADDHLKPDLSFDTLDYQAPRTLVLTNVRLTADDPDTPSERVDVIDAERIRIELAELPRQGAPLKLSVIELDGVNVRLIDSAAGGLVGLSDFVESKPKDTDSAPLSEVLQITEIVINNGAIEYDARLPDAEPMRFDGIDTTLAIDQDEGGRYAVDLALLREGVLDARLIGLADLDQMALAVDDLTASLAVSPDNASVLPPQVQAFIKQYGLVGDLDVQGNGELPFLGVADARARIVARLAQAHGRIGGYRVPIERLVLRTTMQERQVRIEELDGQLFGGQLFGEGRFTLGDDLPASLNLSGNGLRLGELLVLDDPDAVPRFTGNVDLQVNAETPLTDVLNQMTGKGELRVSDGRIARLPLVSGVIEFMESAGDITRRDDAPQGRDEAEIVFELRGDHAYLSKAVIDGSWYAIRSRGKVYFGDKLALHVNAGPLEKVQNALGPIGAPLAAITDGLMAYRVGGGYDDLKIRPVPLAGIIGAPGDDE